MSRYTILHTESGAGWGGQQMRILQEARSFTERGHEVFIACPKGSAIARKSLEEGRPVFLTSLGGAFDLAGILGLWSFIRRRRPDIVNTHSTRDSWTGLLAARLAGRPKTIRTRHILMPIKDSFDNRLLYRRLADVTITTGAAARQQMVTCMGVREDRVVSIPSGVDLAYFDPARGDGSRFRQGLGIDEGAPLVGTVGMLLRMKGHRYFVEAAAEIARHRPDARFVIVGEVPSRSTVKEDLRRQITSLGLEDKFRLAGYRSDVPDVLAGFDVFVLSSTLEGVPQAVAQALAMKRPVVATNVGGVPELVIDGETGLLVEKESPRRIAQAVLDLLADPAGARRMAENGRRVVVEKFSLDAMLDATEALYRRLLNPQPDSAGAMRPERLR